MRWLWKEHFAIGEISVVAGPGNAGKSLLVAGDLASRREPKRICPKVN